MSEANRPTVPVGARTPERAAGVPLGVARLDGAGMVIYVNARAAELVGYAREEMLGRNFAEFFFEEDRPQALADFDQRRHGIGGATENRLLRKDGTSLWVTVASEPTFSADGDFLGVTGFFTDIDGQRRQQEFFVHERRLLRQIAGNYPLSSVLDDLCVTLEAISRRPLFVAVMLADGKLLKCVAAPNLSPRFRADRAAIFLDGDTTPCADAVRNGCEVIVGDATQIEAAPCLDYGFTAVWSYPIVQDGETLGTLALFLPAPGEPDAEDRRAIEFALQVARLALTHERNTLALRASEQRFRDYAELAADWYWEQDADFRFTSMSGGVFNKGGFRVAESLGKTRWELPIEGVSEAQWAEHRTLLARHEAFQNFAYTIRAADGSLRWYSASGKPVFASDGKFLGYRGTSRDISAQKFAEDELRASEQRFRDFAELSADWFWEQDADLRFSRMSGVTNDREERAGFRVTEVLGKMRWELPAEGVDAAQWAEHRAVLARRETFKDFVYALRVANGSLRWFSLSGKPVFAADGEFLGYRGVSRDITRRIAASDKLKKTLNWLEQAVCAAHIGLWERDVDSWTFDFGGNWKELFGYAEDEITPSFEGFDNLVHPDDLERIRAFVRAYEKNPQGDYENRFRIRHKDGSWRWVLSRGSILTDAATGRRTWMGCHIDITEQVRKEDALRASEGLLIEVMELMPVGVWVMDGTGNIVRSNEAGRRIWAGARYVGIEQFGEYKGWWLDSGKLIAAEEWAATRAIRKGETSVNEEIEIECFDGTRKIILNSAMPIRDEAGGISGGIIVNQDITARWQAEQKVRELAAMLETRVMARTAELEEANRELDDFNFSVSHDLRTPLRAIEGFSRALLEDCQENLDATGQGYLQRICRSTTRMGELIDALYELARMSRAPLRLGPVDLSAMASELAAELRAQDPLRVVAVEINATPLVEGDARLLRIVLANLLGNAWKFTAKAASARIVFDAQRNDDGRVVYSVRDNGDGFDMRFADKLFRVFHRLHREEEFTGQGVGLTTVQRIVARHGGNVWGDGEKGRGATFCFTLWDAPQLLAEARQANGEA